MHEKRLAQYSVDYRFAIKAAALLMVSGCVSCAVKPAPLAYAEGHFSVICPSGGDPAIAEVAESGMMPVDPIGSRQTWGVVRLACFPGENESPVLKQDTEHGGKCLGFGKERHLTVRAVQPATTGPEFFVAVNGWVGVAGSSDLHIIETQIHYHDPHDSYNQTYYQQHQCALQTPQ